MKLFICKNCGKFDNTSSDTWKVKRNKDEYTELICPKCGHKKFLKMEVNIWE
jgi:RNase P subunit RPR2